jgi:hypothetical protein
MLITELTDIPADQIRDVRSTSGEVKPFIALPFLNRDVLIRDFRHNPGFRMQYDARGELEIKMLLLNIEVAMGVNKEAGRIYLQRLKDYQMLDSFIYDQLETIINGVLNAQEETPPEL